MRRLLATYLRKPSTLSLVAVLILMTALLPSASAGGNGGLGGVQPLARMRPGRIAPTQSPPPTDAECRASFGVACYSPQEVWNGYGIANILAAGDRGSGQTIVIFDSYGSPTIQSDLATFDAGFGLPPPPSFKVLAPLGSVPWDPNNATMVGWGEETSLDVEWSHAIAPDASIVLVTSPAAETEGVAGMPEFLQLEAMALQQHWGQIWSQSWGATENTLYSSVGDGLLNNFNTLYQQAGQAGITVFASAGDGGVSNAETNGTNYPFPTVLFPASSPYVTAVGGTNLFLTTQGAYQSEVVWNDGYGAGGGGKSGFFNEPSYQVSSLPSSTQSFLQGWRGVPDISYNAGVLTGVSVYLGFSGITSGWYVFGGTSAGSPQWSGLTADLNQALGHPMGFLNPLLYQLGQGSVDGVRLNDIRSGNNSFNGLTGYNAKLGWDPASGWGSPDARVSGALLQLAAKP